MGIASSKPSANPISQNPVQFVLELCKKDLSEVMVKKIYNQSRLKLIPGFYPPVNFVLNLHILREIVLEIAEQNPTAASNAFHNSINAKWALLCRPEKFFGTILGHCLSDLRYNKEELRVSLRLLDIIDTVLSACRYSCGGTPSNFVTFDAFYSRLSMARSLLAQVIAVEGDLTVPALSRLDGDEGLCVLTCSLGNVLCDNGSYKFAVHLMGELLSLISGSVSPVPIWCISYASFVLGRAFLGLSKIEGISLIAGCLHISGESIKFIAPGTFSSIFDVIENLPELRTRCQTSVDAWQCLLDMPVTTEELSRIQYRYFKSLLGMQDLNAAQKSIGRANPDIRKKCVQQLVKQIHPAENILAMEWDGLENELEQILSSYESTFRFILYAWYVRMGKFQTAAEVMLRWSFSLAQQSSPLDTSLIALQTALNCMMLAQDSSVTAEDGTYVSINDLEKMILSVQCRIFLGTGRQSLSEWEVLLGLLEKDNLHMAIRLAESFCLDIQPIAEYLADELVDSKLAGPEWEEPDWIYKHGILKSSDAIRLELSRLIRARDDLKTYIQNRLNTFQVEL